MAIYYFRNVGTNWGDAANWSLTDGGGATGAVPLATDDAYFTSNSGNCTVNATARVCRTLIFSGVGAGNYANTFTVSNNVTVSGNVTLSATMTIAGTATLRIDATSTLTSNGKTWTGGLTIVGNQTVTLSGNWTINGSFDTTNTSGTVTINSNTLTIGGSFTSTLTAGNITGTTSIVLNGTGTLSTNSTTTGAIQNNLTINTSGTITFGTTIGYNTRTFTYTAGTVVTTGSTFVIRAGCTMDTDRGVTQINFSTISVILATATLTLSSNLNVTNFTVASASNLTISSGVNDLLATTMTLATAGNGVITIGKNTQVTNLILASGGVGRIDGAFNFSVSGNLTHNSASNTIGSATIVLNGTGTWSHTSTGAIVSNLTINTLGTITLGTNVRYNTGILTYTAGTVVATGSTLNIQGTCTLATNGMTWNNITTTNTTGNITVTLSNNLTCTGDFTALGTTGDTNLTGSTFTIGGSLVSSLTSGVLGGTTNIVLNGSGTLSTNSSTTNAIVSNLTINTTGTITIGTVLAFNTRTLTYTAGTVNATTTTLRLFLGGCTLATDGIVWNNIISISVANSATYTLSNNLTCTGNFTTLMAANTLTFNGSTFTIGGGFIADSLISNFVTGTTNIVLNGTGTLSTNSATAGGCVRNNLTINTTGVITLGTVFSYGVGTFTYVSGTVVTSGNTLLVFGGSYDSNGIIWNNITSPGLANSTMTLSSNMTCSSNLTVTTLTTNTFTINGSTLAIGGSFTANSLTIGLITGTTNIIMNGTGTLSTNSATTGRINNPITINTSGTIAFGTILNYGGSSFTITRGRINTRGNTLNLLASCTFSFKAINFNNVIITDGTTITMDEFFNGAPDQKATISSTTASNYTITFLDGFEKFAKFVNVNNATLTRRGQLILITNQVVPSTNLGIRRINSFPNGVGSQGNFKPLYIDSVPPMGDTRLLTSDPAFN